jgi:CsoR family transcriptional regulator, copper-sensing transcriptional repressor
MGEERVEGQEKPRGSYGEHRGALLARLRRIEGQVRGIQRMVESDTYCVDIITQLSAVIAACEKVGLKVLEDHIRGCVADAIGSEDGEAKIAELTKVLERFLQVGRSAVSAGSA